jgi:RND family efflux transporter MFP subunit
MQFNLSIPALALVSVLALSACGRHPAPATTAGTNRAVKETPPLPVTVAVAEERPMPRYLQVTGELKSGLDAAVAANAAGKVMVAPVERGSVVKAGDVLVKLDDRAAVLALREADAHVSQAQSRLDFAIAEWKRNEPLAKTRAISAADLEKLAVEQKSARADLDAAMARRDTTKKNLDDMVIRAPFTGSVMERQISPGEYVQLHTQVVHLVANDHLRLLLNVPETASGIIEMGQEVSFEVPAYPGRTFTAVVKYIGGALRESSRDLMVEANVPNADGALKQGMFAEGRLLLPEKPGVAVPKSAVRTAAGQPRVFVVEHAQVTERLVDLGEHSGDWLEIRSGVSKGETVVTDPAASTVDGVRITVAMKP